MTNTVRIYKEETIIYTKCPHCNSKQNVTVTTKEYSVWKSGLINIQHAFPNLSNNAREHILTGTCNTCWDKFFK